MPIADPFNLDETGTVDGLDDLPLVVRSAHGVKPEHCFPVAREEMLEWLVVFAFRLWRLVHIFPPKELVKLEPIHFNLPRRLEKQVLVLGFRRGQQRIRKLLVSRNVDVAADLGQYVPRGWKVDRRQSSPHGLLPHHLLLHGR